MGIRFHRSINLGLGFRINISKSGIGFSWGIPGYRITKTATGSTRKTYSIPGTGLSYVETTKKQDSGKFTEEEYQRLKAKLDEINTSIENYQKKYGLDEKSLAIKAERTKRINNAKTFILSNSDIDKRVFDAIDIILEFKSCSASLLERRMKISFEKASAIVTQLEKLDFVGQSNGGIPRDIYINDENIADKVEALAILISDEIEAKIAIKKYPDEVGEYYEGVFTSLFGCNVEYICDADIYKDDEFYQLRFRTEETISNISSFEDLLRENVYDVIHLAQTGNTEFEATIWLAPESL